ncbi:MULTISPECIES: dicarboxylate/amino acid:cation symporter [Pontibacillus]|uniref:Dicarboxylate/amino acid:cation symporter n=1 Tax=Pontibacillus chungwhensis TaxID=265426 RepID=A0ABY8V2C2_9BACI|nr:MULTISPECIES: dicarboxylate/amino acid:cation symporter [Pontibacillus]MCD5324553.1 dicarboxylate/amino acid:cation symporter [Pontibacillus sp. HN14]WIF99151.1 dicarboxylate/amino acid:cation symporter [Pontibacillus chungwhensis]
MKKLFNTYIETSFVLKMFVGFLAGTLLALAIGEQATVVKPLGDLLINLLKLIAIPVIFLTVVLAVDQMNLPTLGRMGGKLILYYIATTAAAVFIGLGLGFLVDPGKNLELPNADVEKPDTPSFGDVLMNIIPDNIVAPFVNGDLMSILFLSVIIGIAISTMKFSTDEKMKEYGELLDRFFQALNELFYKLLKGILLYAPIGIFGVSASSFGGQGWETLQSLLSFTAVFYAGVALLWILVYTSFLKLSGHSLKPFFSATKDAYTTAFFTSSSVASLPVAIDTAKKAGISERVAHFTLPLGAVFNSDGGALRMGVSIVFAANITDLSLSVGDFFTIVVIGTLLSVGTAGVPAAGLVTLSAVLTMFNLPLEIVALIAGVDVLIGMAGTASNVFGDIVGAAVVDRSEEKVGKTKKTA